MTKHALFLQHRTKPGARDDVQKIWQKHMQPAIAGNPDHEIYVYSFGDGPDRICAFQVYSSAEAANAFLKSQAYRDYEQEVTPLLEGPPTVEALKPQFIKHQSYPTNGDNQ
jgi:quinol monooxygenase YgiN